MTEFAKLAHDLEGKTNEVQKFVNAQNLNKMIKLNVSGLEKEVGRNTLTKVQGSKLEQMFNGVVEIGRKTDEPFDIDRDPVVFDHLIEYLRQDRKVIPHHYQQDLLEKFQEEIIFWDLAHDLQRYDQMTFPKLKWDVMQLL